MSRQRIQFYQWVMALRGHHPRDAASLDGLLGRTTTAATESYQRANGLPVTGRLDSATVAVLNADGSRLALAGQNPPSSLPAGSGTRVAVTGSHPPVAAIQTAPTATAPAQTIAIPAKVAQMIPPSTVAQLQTMPAPQVQAFVNDLAQKVATAESGLTSEGTGKDITAVPLVSPDGTVRAAVQAVETGVGAATGTGTGWWANLTPNERIGYGVGGAVVGVAVIGGLAYMLSEKGRR